MRNIVALGASNSRKSINKKFAKYTAEQLEDTTINLLDLNDFEMPIYSIDREKETGIPDLAHQFKNHLRKADGIIISFAEHNGAYSVAFKNVMDWISRIDKNVWESKPMFLLATSPGGRGGQTVLDIAVNKFKFMNPNTIVQFSLPSFGINFSEENGILESDLALKFREKLSIFDVVTKTIKEKVN